MSNIGIEVRRSIALLIGLAIMIVFKDVCSGLTFLIFYALFFEGETND